MNKLIRWKQRFQNLEKAFSQLQSGVELATVNQLEKQGVIQSFEFTFELAWKTLKDYLESQNVIAQFPKDVLKQAFHYGLLDDGEIWMEMLEIRNLLAHTYDQEKADEAYRLIQKRYFPVIKKVFHLMKSK